MRRTQRAAVLISSLALLAVPVLADRAAAAGPVGGVLVPCLTPAAARTHDADVPKWRSVPDTPAVTKSDVAALPAQNGRRTFATREAVKPLRSIVQLGVRVHVIRGTHRGEANPAGPMVVRRLVSVLNSAMAGNQSSASASSRYRFVLKGINYTKRDDWHHAHMFGPRNQAMRRALHQGTARTLNLYITGGPIGTPVLGWARFPWQYAAYPRLDGVTITTASLFGGAARGYNLGDTLVHETGHWLGLFHTFQGGCGVTGDGVADTPAEAFPSYECKTQTDSCSAPGRDPVRNFMDYSYDWCMNQWTEGQVDRLDAAFRMWRY